MSANKVIQIYPGSLPVNNLLASGLRRCEPENELTSDFACAYQQRHQRIHSITKKCTTLFIREVPISGYGIADLLVFSWKGNPGSGESVGITPTIRAFEVKMTDWRRGLMQAHRYRYYANTSILVVPKTVLPRVFSHLRLFQNAEVGLWGFNPHTKGITRVYTPRPRAINSGCKPYQRALRVAQDTITSS
jgi:hypothetical protein